MENPKPPFTVTIEWRIVNFASCNEYDPICMSRTVGKPDIRAMMYPKGRNGYQDEMEVRLYGELKRYDCELSYFGNDGTLIHSHESDWEPMPSFDGMITGVERAFLPLMDEYQCFYNPEFESLAAHVRKHEAVYGDHLTVRFRFRAPGEEREECKLTVVKAKEGASSAKPKADCGSREPVSSSSKATEASPAEPKADCDSCEPVSSAPDASSPSPAKKAKSNATSGEPSASKPDGFLLRVEVCGNLCVGVTLEDFFASYPMAKDCFGKRPAVALDTLKSAIKQLKKVISVNARDANSFLEQYVEFITKFGTICAEGFSLVGPFVRGKEDQLDYLVSVQRRFDDRLKRKGKMKNPEVKCCWLIAQMRSEDEEGIPKRPKKADGHSYFYLNASPSGRGHVFVMDRSGKCDFFTHSFAEFLDTNCKAHEVKMVLSRSFFYGPPATKKRRVISFLDGFGVGVENGRFQIESSDVPFREHR